MVPSPVDIRQLQNDLRDHGDRVFVDYLVDGFTFGFDTKVQLPVAQFSSKECKNLQSAFQNKDDVTHLIKTELSKGFLAGPFKYPPFDVYRVSPIGVVEGKYSKKKRLIIDLSAPHNDAQHDSINSLINKEECSLSYVRIDDAIEYIAKCGQGSLLCKADISDAFKLIPIKPEQYHLFCIKWQDLYYFSSKLAFGSRSSPVIFDSFSKAICWIAMNKYNIKFILHLLDDFLTIDQPGEDAQQTMDTLKGIFKRLNVPLSEHKTVGPSTVLEYLGIILDTDNMQAKLPLDKVLRITDMLTKFLCRRTCTKRELLQLLGHLNFASRVIVPGRTFVSYLLGVAWSVSELHHHVHLTSSCREDIRMWLLFLQQWNGVSMFYDSKRTASHDMELYTDASLIGHGGYFQGHWFCANWPHSLIKELEGCDSMAFRELYPIVVAALLWAPSWSKKRILFYCDNMSTVQIVQKGRSKVPCIMQLMRRLTWTSAKFNFCIYAQHLPGVTNNIADSLSRLQLQRFRQLAPSADALPQAIPPPQDVLWNYPTPHTR